MSFSIYGTTIVLTRGDTFAARVSILDSDGNPYLPQPGDSIRFAMKRSFEDFEIPLIKEIPTDTMLLVLNPEDTKNLPFGQYAYDIQLTKATGEVDTFINRAKLKLTEEVC